MISETENPQILHRVDDDEIGALGTCEALGKLLGRVAPPRGTVLHLVHPQACDAPFERQIRTFLQTDVIDLAVLAQFLGEQHHEGALAAGRLAVHEPAFVARRPSEGLLPLPVEGETQGCAGVLFIG